MNWIGLSLIGLLNAPHDICEGSRNYDKCIVYAIDCMKHELPKRNFSIDDVVENCYEMMPQPFWPE